MAHDALFDERHRPSEVQPRSRRFSERQTDAREPAHEQSTLLIIWRRDYVARHQTTLPCFEGEFRWGRYSEILQSTRHTTALEQCNHRVETLLERVTELLAMACLPADVTSRSGDRRFAVAGLALAAANHPHDDMYGCDRRRS
jgi:hypothetical protein